MCINRKVAAIFMPNLDDADAFTVLGNHHGKSGRDTPFALNLPPAF